MVNVSLPIFKHSRENNSRTNDPKMFLYLFNRDYLRKYFCINTKFKFCGSMGRKIIYGRTKTLFAFQKLIEFHIFFMSFNKFLSILTVKEVRILSSKKNENFISFQHGWVGK